MNEKKNLLLSALSDDSARLVREKSRINNRRLQNCFHSNVNKTRRNTNELLNPKIIHCGFEKNRPIHELAGKNSFSLAFTESFWSFRLKTFVGFSFCTTFPFRVKNSRKKLKGLARVGEGASSLIFFFPSIRLRFSRSQLFLHFRFHSGTQN
jgi:hypothetical protein